MAVKKYQQYRDLFPACIMAGCGLLFAQILLSQTIWKKAAMTFGAPQWFWALLADSGTARCFSCAAERRAGLRLREFVSERLLPNLARTVDRRRRDLRFVLVLAWARARDHGSGPAAMGIHL